MPSSRSIKEIIDTIKGALHEKNGADQYRPTDEYLLSLKSTEATPLELARHLKTQLQAHRATRSGTTLKTITVIRQMIEEKGGNPEKLLKQIEEEDHNSPSVHLPED